MRSNHLAVLMSGLLTLVACEPVDPEGVPPEGEQPPLAIPETPQKLSFVAGNRQVWLMWEAPQQALEGHSVYVAQGAGEPTLVGFARGPQRTYLVTGLENGQEYRFSLEARSPQGRSSERSKEVSAKPHEDAAAPGIRFTSPGNTATSVERTKGIGVYFTKQMDPASVTVTLSPNVPLIVEGWSEMQDSVTFELGSALAANTRYTLRVEGKDYLGIAMRSFSASFTTGEVFDQTAPSVASTSPSAFLTEVNAERSIVLTFSEPVLRETVESRFSTQPALNCAFTWAEGDKQVRCNPSPHMATNTRYEVTVAPGVTDRFGNVTATSHLFSFTTGSQAPGTPPTLVMSSPAAGSTGLTPEGGLGLHFSEEMDDQSTRAAFRIEDSKGAPVPGRLEWSTLSPILQFTPSGPLPYGEVITWKMLAGAKDQAGYALTPSEGTFQIARLGTSVLKSVASLDGTVGSGGLVTVTGGSVTCGDTATNEEKRAFFSFDLSTLPATITQFREADLYVSLEGTAGQPAAELSNLIAEHVAYGTSLSSDDFNTPRLPVGRDCGIFFCSDVFYDRTVGITGDTGWRAVGALPKVNNDWNNRSARGFRSQYRLRFATASSADSGADHVTFASGEAANAAYLMLTYLYP
jgi:hypothetical protein